MQSVACKVSCRRTALKRCIKIEILCYRKLVSRASSEFSEIFLPRSSMIEEVITVSKGAMSAPSEGRKLDEQRELTK